MHDAAGGHGPFPFRAVDLTPDRLAEGVRHTLADFRRWRDANPDRIADHVAHYRAHVDALATRHRLPAVTRRRLSTRRRQREARAHAAREVVHFGVYDMAEAFSPETAHAIAGDLRARRAVAAHVPGDVPADIPGLRAVLEEHLPALRGRPETEWLADRLAHLHRTLPAPVIHGGSMGKVVRTIVGVLTIGAYAVGAPRHGGPAHREPDRERLQHHLADILPGAYAYGAAYAIVDDTLHDLQSAVTTDEQQRYHALIAHGLATGEAPDVAELPDHPLADELHDLHTRLLERYPFDRDRHLYHAAEAMYQAQHRDAGRTLARTAGVGPADLYPDLFVKAGMSRVVANLLARRELADTFYTRCINTTFMSQLRDDLVDRHEDHRHGRLTPFTAPRGADDTDPLYDLFAYSAYVCSQVYGDDPTVTDALTYRGATRLTAHLTGGPGRAEELLRTYEASDAIARFLRDAADLPTRAAGATRRLDDTDQRIKHQVGALLRHRAPTAVDCRTYVADHRPYIEEVLTRYRPWYLAGELGDVVAYAMDGTAKRLRPALTLMLADCLGVDHAAVEPMLVAGELFHTASLIFDDLPAQDDAAVRRGRPAVHAAFGEARAQLAALSMISSGFGLVAQLDRRFPPHRVNEVVSYIGGVFGPARLCRGQYLDLRLARGDAAPDTEAIREVYSLKTSTALEAALVPLAMVRERPQAETTALSRYAHHAGVVFQLRDDVLDATAGPAQLGKDTDHDAAKVNVVRSAGLETAEQLTEHHVAAAGTALDDLPYDTGLLARSVRHFATRRR